MEDPGSVWGCVVVGAGVMGSATALQLAESGVRTLLLEQFALPHTLGSSVGGTRVIRRAYRQQLAYMADIVTESLSMWRRLEEETGVKLLVPKPFVVVASKTVKGLRSKARTLHAAGLPYRLAAGPALRTEFPALRYPAEFTGLVDEQGAQIRADKAIKCLQEVFLQKGGVLRDGERLETISPGDVITLRTSRGTLRTRRLVLTCGPWAGDVMAGIGLHPPLQVMPINLLYMRKSQGALLSVRDDFPCMFDDDNEVGAFPSLEHPETLKGGTDRGHTAHPDRRDADMAAQLAADQAFLRDYVCKHFPDFENRPCLVERCMYTNTPDGNFILDRHPTHPNIVFGTGFSGHGFMAAPVVGQLLCQMVLDQPTSHDVTPFSLSRFKPSAKSSM
ncbi:PREDICTED: peroxisomal sarcosine oxidase-like [Branchiostoma belcheri]|uniref:Peroxisomal sarcosine oxidase-like n=1 Tax=Branchiostoma belcheri TaxID=7741 RepID=A0A6P5AN34_BRABE|nr:PREDICTED: peroxisomal sarcosine oxidase-like [Branchiostoma belcheri]